MAGLSITSTQYCQLEFFCDPLLVSMHKNGRCVSARFNFRSKYFHLIGMVIGGFGKIFFERYLKFCSKLPDSFLNHIGWTVIHDTLHYSFYLNGSTNPE